MIAYLIAFMLHRTNSYTAIFEPAPEGGFVVSVPMLPGCISQGETFEEAKQNIQDAILGYIATLREDGDPVPVETAESVVTRIAAPDPA